MSPSSNMVQHSSSDAGRSSGDEAKKTPAGRVPTSTFGFKKPNGVHGPATVVSTSSITLMTASGHHYQRLCHPGQDSQILRPSGRWERVVKRGFGWFTAPSRRWLPVPQCSFNAAVPKSTSTLPFWSRARNGNRSSTSSIESSLSSRTPVLTAVTTSKPRDSGTKTNGHVIQANQTDKEKGVTSDMDNLRTNRSFRRRGGNYPTDSETGKQVLRGLVSNIAKVGKGTGGTYHTQNFTLVNQSFH